MLALTLHNTSLAYPIAILPAIMQRAANVVDVDDTMRVPLEKLVVVVDRARAARLGVTQQAVVDAVSMACMVLTEGSRALFTMAPLMPVTVRAQPDRYASYPSDSHR